MHPLSLNQRKIIPFIRRIPPYRRLRRRRTTQRETNKNSDDPLSRMSVRAKAVYDVRYVGFC